MCVRCVRCVRCVDSVVGYESCVVGCGSGTCERCPRYAVGCERCGVGCDRCSVVIDVLMVAYLMLCPLARVSLISCTHAYVTVLICDYHASLFDAVSAIFICFYCTVL